MKKLREILGEKFSKEMETWLQNNKITRNMQAREPAEAPSKPAFDRAAFDAKIADMKKKIDAEGPFITNKQSKSVHWDDKIANKINRIDIRRSAPKTVIPEPVDFTGANSPFAAPQVKSYDREKQERQNEKLAGEKKWQTVYKKPAGYGTPSYDRARDKDDVEWKSKLPPNPYNDVPAEAVPGSTRPQFVDTMKTNPIVPVPIPKPKAKPAEIDQRVPRPKMRPDKQGPIQRVEIKWPKQIQDRVPQENSGLKGMQANNPDISGSLLKGFKYEPEKKSKQITDRVPQGEPPKLDNTKGAVPIPKPDSIGINVKPSDKKTAPNKSTKIIQKGDTFWDIAGGNPEEVKRLKKLNPNINPSKLQIGQEIKLK